MTFIEVHSHVELKEIHTLNDNTLFVMHTYIICLNKRRKKKDICNTIRKFKIESLTNYVRRLTLKCNKKKIQKFCTLQYYTSRINSYIRTPHHPC